MSEDMKDDASAALGQQSVLTKLVLKYGVSYAKARQMCWRTLAGGEGTDNPSAWSKDTYGPWLFRRERSPSPKSSRQLSAKSKARQDPEAGGSDETATGPPVSVPPLP